MDDIVKGAGIPKGTFYLFYPSKEQLLFELMMEEQAVIQSALLRAVEEAGSRMTRECFAALVYDPFQQAAMALFALSPLPWYTLLAAAVLNAAVSAAVAMLVLSCAKNKVEGMALTKLSGVVVAGLLAAFLTSAPASYLAGVLPSFWIGKLAFLGKLLFALPGAACAALWLWLLYGRFCRRVCR